MCQTFCVHINDDVFVKKIVPSPTLMQLYHGCPLVREKKKHSLKLVHYLHVQTYKALYNLLETTKRLNPRELLGPFILRETTEMAASNVFKLNG